ncbi:MAG: hypothetical protein AMS18_02710 [Gemmatimonas sp. SG8_17]|nr:MAG: hypothetical protein AMS18_02710 [Gemmatimonas sp. SG8_17]
MSSSDFRPVWPVRVKRDLQDLPLPNIPGTSSPSGQSAEGHLQLKDFAVEPAGQPPSSENRAADTTDLIQHSYQRGFSDGLDQGIAQTYEKIATGLEALAGLMQSLEQTRADFTRDLEQSLYALAIAIARHLMQREVRTDPTIVRELVQQALALVPHDMTLEVRLNPEDLEALHDQLDQVGISGRPLHIQWLADSTLERGGFLLETPLRVVDGRPDDALRALYDRLSHE